MSPLLLTALFLSLDSFVVSIALSPLINSPVSRWRLASLFGICDGLAVLVGSALSQSAPGLHINERVVPFFVAVIGLYCLVAAQWKQIRANPGLVGILPFLMSLDNLAYGAGIGKLTASVFAQALALAAASLALAAMGLYIGSFVRFASARASELATGIGLLAAGFVLFVV
jgi:putative Mn2+ efflux pump MntP